MSKLLADKVLFSENIFTAENSELLNGGVAVLGNHIIAVGSCKEIENYIGDDTEVIDFGEKFLMPGLCDSHVHLLMGCMATMYPDLGEAKTADECGKMLYDHFMSDPDFYEDGEWVLGFNWYHSRWPDKNYPHKEVLDKYFPDRPVFLMNADLHGAWVNSKALEICGVDENTPDVPYGTLHRNPDGSPTGYLGESSCALCMDVAYTLPERKIKMLIEKVNGFFSGRGITSVCDIQYLLGVDIGDVPAYCRLAEENNLNFRINYATSLFGDTKKILADYAKYNNKQSMVYFLGLKAFMDGIIPTHTAIMLEPYTDQPDAPISYDLMDLDEAERLVKLYQGLGLNILLHAVGDGAIRKALNIYENANKENGKTKSRLSIEHWDLVNPADMLRLKDIEVIASVQPPHITLSPSLENNDYPPVVGPEREKFLWPYKSVADSGATLAFGTDYPVVYDSPWITLHRAVTRKFSDGKPEGGWNPEQKIPIADALVAYTLGGAKKFGKEEHVGTLSAGKLADIIVLDRNLMTIDPDDILNTNVLFTMVDGRVVLQK